MNKKYTGIVDEMKNTKHLTNKPSSDDFERALEQIYRNYGSDFDAFFRDAKESVGKKRSKDLPDNRSLETCIA